VVELQHALERVRAQSAQAMSAWERAVDAFENGAENDAE